MKNGNKVRVKFKLDKHRFVVLEVEEEKLPIVRENNREVSRNEKRETRHESMYSLETLSEAKGIEQSDEKIDIEEQIIETVLAKNMVSATPIGGRGQGISALLLKSISF